MTRTSKRAKAPNLPPPVDGARLLDQDFAWAFNPRSVAVVGASRVSWKDGPNWANPSGRFVPHLLNLGYRGRIYPINPRASEILGLKVYPDLSSLPETPDMVTVSVPARFLADVLRQCAAIGARNIHVFTTGFSEVATAEGIAMEKEVLEVARGAGLRMLGPNCLGIHSPKYNFSTLDEIKNRPGGVSFIAQSGGHAMNFIYHAAEIDLGVSKVISFGNALVLDSTDLLEFLAEDPETDYIGMYLEGVKDGRKLLRLVKQVNRVKPVIIWKGGLTSIGSRAAASHTGSLAGQREIWDAFFKQTGAVRANSVEEIADVMRAFMYVPDLRGNRVVLLGSGGGNSVAAADICALEGLDMPVLSRESSEQLRDFVPDAGNSVRNPLDLSFMPNVRDRQMQAAAVVSRDPSIDILMVIPSLSEYGETSDQPEKAVASDLLLMAREKASGKPVVAVLPNRIRDPSVKMDFGLLQRECDSVGILAYPSLSKACRALARFHNYHREQQALDGNR